MKTRKCWKCMAVYVAAILLAGGVATAVAVSATGGDATNDINGDRIYTFTTIGNASFTVSGGPLNCDVLVVAGGGAGGSGAGGGGGAGAGGVLYVTNCSLTSGVYSVTVGGGGAPVNQNVGGNGTNSALGTNIALKGAGGSYSGSAPVGGSGTYGSGAGGSYGGAGAGGAGTPGQGNNGGSANSQVNGGGGGGGGGVGGGATGAAGGNGGAGLSCSISGTTTNYGGGGGGGKNGSNTPGAGGAGGGGAGGPANTTAGTNGTPNSGGGGGGGSDGNAAGGYGGSGIVIVKYSLGVPLIGNLATTNVTSTSAYLNGNLISTGTAPLTVVAVYWGTNDGQSVAGNWANTNTFSPTPLVAGVLTTNIAGLASGTLYYYSYYATNSLGEGWASPSAMFITGEITVQATRPRASESITTNANGVFTIYRPDDGSTNAALTVNYAMSGTAVNGVDYVLLSGVVTIPAGATNATVTVAPIADGLAEPAETAILTLTGGGIVGSPGNATVTIIASPTTWYVSTNGLDTNSGTNWAEAFLTISNGVAWAANGDEVRVGTGTFTVATEVVLSKPIAVIGNGHTGPQSIIRQTNDFRVFTLSNANARLDGLVVENGLNWDGGNVKMLTGTVTNCVIRGNRGIYKSIYGGGAVGAHGGGISMSGGLITGSIISNNIVNGAINGNYYPPATEGGGVYMTGGTLRRTCVVGNRAYVQEVSGAITVYGGGVSIAGAGAVVENCMIRNNLTDQGNTNTLSTFTGGGVYLTAGTLRNCTIVANSNVTPGSSWGGGVWQTGGTMVNCIVSSNTATPATVGKNYGSTTGGGATTPNVKYSCAPELVSGTGNIVYPPLFVNPSASDYHLQYGSPGIDTGSNMTGVVTDDFDGNSRPVDGLGTGAARWDMGAYEAAAATNLPELVCSPVANPTVGLAPMSNVVFTAGVGGPSAATNINYWWWTFGDGQTAAGPIASVVTNTYNLPGAYTVTLTVSNSLGQVTNGVKVNYIVAMGTTVCVATNGANIPPWQNWSNATPSFSVGLDLAKRAITLGAPSAQVMVGTGTFSLADAAMIGNPITVSGAGPNVTVIHQSGVSLRVFSLTNGTAVIQNLAIENGGQVPGNGGGVYMTTGLVNNCVIRNNGTTYGNSSTYGGGVYMSGGVLQGCTITNNTAVNYFDGLGGGVYMSGGTLRRCLLAYNMAKSTQAYVGDNGTYNGGGGGVYMSGGIVESCIVRNNSLPNSGKTVGGGGVNMTGGTLRNCTIMTNICGTSVGPSGGVRQTGGTSVNCIVWGNMATNTPSDYSGTAQAVTYSCAPELTSGAGNKTNDPLFIAPLSANYHLSLTSPCVDTGTNQSWMITATDMDGNPRILAGRVDMGAYESTPKPGTVISIR